MGGGVVTAVGTLAASKRGPAATSDQRGPLGLHRCSLLRWVAVTTPALGHPFSLHHSSVSCWEALKTGK